MDARALNDSIMDISRRVASDMDWKTANGICIVGIKTMGEAIARRMAVFLSKITGKPVPLGFLDITLYRDDLGHGGRKWPEVKETEMPFSVEGMNVLVVDDVIFTGRTARAAIEAVTDYGRPDRIALAVIADIGNREFPIHPDYCALKVKAGKNRRVVLVMNGGRNEAEEGVFLRGKGRL